jgi:membrane protein YdbS with pleckstrin-like domain
MEKDAFKSRVDFWLMLVVFAAPAFAVFQGLYLLPDEPVGKYIAIGVGAFLMVVIPLALFPCKYMLADDHLNIQCGRFRQKIPYSEIRAVEISGSWLSAPALSMRRVQISFGRESQLVSPRDRETFIKQLKTRVANLKLSGKASSRKA